MKRGGIVMRPSAPSKMQGETQTLSQLESNTNKPQTPKEKENTLNTLTSNSPKKSEQAKTNNHVTHPKVGDSKVAVNESIKNHPTIIAQLFNKPNPKIPSQLNANIGKNYKLILALLAQHPNEYSTILNNASYALRQDPNFMLAAIKINSAAIAYADPILKNDEVFLAKIFELIAHTEENLLNVVASCPLIFKPSLLEKAYAPFMQAPRFNLSAWQRNKEIVRHNPSLLKDKEFLLQIVKQNVDILQQVESSILENSDFMLEVIKKNNYAIQYLPAQLYKIIIPKLTEKEKNLTITTILKKDSNQAKTVLPLIAKNKHASIIESAFMHHGCVSLLEHIDDDSKNNKALFKKLIEINGAAYFFASKAMQRDKEILDAFAKSKKSNNIRIAFTAHGATKNFLLNNKDQAWLNEEFWQYIDIVQDEVIQKLQYYISLLKQDIQKITDKTQQNRLQDSIAQMEKLQSNIEGLCFGLATMRSIKGEKFVRQLQAFLLLNIENLQALDDDSDWKQLKSTPYFTDALKEFSMMDQKKQFMDAFISAMLIHQFNTDLTPTAILQAINHDNQLDFLHDIEILEPSTTTQGKAKVLVPNPKNITSIFGNFSADDLSQLFDENWMETTQKKLFLILNQSHAATADYTSTQKNSQKCWKCYEPNLHKEMQFFDKKELISSIISEFGNQQPKQNRRPLELIYINFIEKNQLTSNIVNSEADKALEEIRGKYLTMLMQPNAFLKLYNDSYSLALFLEKLTPNALQIMSTEKIDTIKSMLINATAQNPNNNSERDAILNNFLTAIDIKLLSLSNSITTKDPIYIAIVNLLKNDGSQSYKLILKIASENTALLNTLLNDPTSSVTETHLAAAALLEFWREENKKYNTFDTTIDDISKKNPTIAALLNSIEKQIREKGNYQEYAREVLAVLNKKWPSLPDELEEFAKTHPVPHLASYLLRALKQRKQLTQELQSLEKNNWEPILPPHPITSNTHKKRTNNTSNGRENNNNKYRKYKYVSNKKIKMTPQQTQPQAPSLFKTSPYNLKQENPPPIKTKKRKQEHLGNTEELNTKTPTIFVEPQQKNPKTNTDGDHIDKKLKVTTITPPEK
jgi:hypothetical protein